MFSITREAVPEDALLKTYRGGRVLWLSTALGISCHKFPGAAACGKARCDETSAAGEEIGDHEQRGDIAIIRLDHGIEAQRRGTRQRAAQP